MFSNNRIVMAAASAMARFMRSAPEPAVLPHRIGDALPIERVSATRRTSTRFDGGLNGARAVARRRRQRETGRNDQRYGYMHDPYGDATLRAR